jgi:EAL domain-containing protein (putative c-di-GMP-specific phosphodiesterase class I)
MDISQRVSFVLQPVLNTDCAVGFFELLTRCGNFDVVLEHLHLELLELSCAFAAAVSDELGLPVTVNVEPASINEAPSLVQSLLENSGVWAEVTERGKLSKPALTAMCSFARAGGVLWIDDLGTGDSTFAARGGLFDAGAVGGVKVDVEHLFTTYQLALPVVCEHIETPSDMQAAMAAGVDYFQGFLFARPLDVASAVSFAEQAAGTLLGASGS